MENCQICISPLNKSTRQNISCLKCLEGCCLSCIKTFLESTKSEPTCMFCNETLSKYDLIRMKLPKSYLEKEYKLIRQDILFKNDKSHFSESLQYVKEWVNNSNIYKESVEIYNESKQLLSNVEQDRIPLIQSKINHFKKLTKSLDKGKDIDIVLRELQQLSQNKEMVEYKKHSELKSIHRRKIDMSELKKKHMIQDIRNGNVNCGKKLPTIFCQEDSCNGMLDETFKCVTCKKSYCSDCNMILNLNHKCDKNNIKSFNLIKNQTKPCPKCFIPIYKIHGCDQMFCTSCHTPFSWNTGLIIKNTGFFHNPHYFDHLNDGGRNIFTDIDRNDSPPILWAELYQKIKPYSYEIRNDILDLYRKLLELIDVKLNRFIEDPNKKVERVKYLSNDITELQYKRFLSKEDKTKEFLFNIDKIYELFYQKAFEHLITFPSISTLKILLRDTTKECSDCITNVCNDFGFQSKKRNLVILRCIPDKSLLKYRLYYNE